MRLLPGLAPSQVPPQWRFLRRRWGSRRSRGNRRWSSVVYQVFQLFAGLEERDFLGRHFDLFPGLGIAAGARFALAGAEAAEAADLDLVAGAQGSHHAVENGFHNHFTVFARKFS